MCIVYRPTQSIIYVPLQVNRFQKILLLIVQYNILNPVLEILFPRIWSSAQDCAVLCCLLNPVVFLISAWQKSVRRNWFVLVVYQVWKGISAGPALKYFTWFIVAGEHTHDIYAYVYVYVYMHIRVLSSWRLPVYIVARAAILHSTLVT